MPGALEDLLARRSPRTIAEVIALMEAIDAALPTADGIAWFNKLHLEVTRAVSAAVGAGRFGEGRFLRWLDVSFANLFFRALRHDLTGEKPVAKAWAPLFEARGRHDVAPIQFALAGMNAHINRDLPVALGEAWAGTRVDPSAAQHVDFTAVNALLAATEDRVKEWFATGFLGEIDRDFRELDDLYAMWSVGRAREAAWVNGKTLWTLRAVPPVREDYLATLDRMVGFAGRGLLRPVVP